MFPPDLSGKDPKNDINASNMLVQTRKESVQNLMQVLYESADNQWPPLATPQNGVANHHDTKEYRRNGFRLNGFRIDPRGFVFSEQILVVHSNPYL
ncbi:hypothetical protein EVAR_12974_1 [Eumeta japonica]|uniref:Uncharacterized protein n=1 Tax=Eumeta variegata TaxID=151549 RepID=A0A4C1TWT1_EUMVA|nr:hypothetical protein EVAR_12974_1 [Eumeta japonica]